MLDVEAPAWTVASCEVASRRMRVLGGQWGTTQAAGRATTSAAGQSVEIHTPRRTASIFNASCCCCCCCAGH